MSYHGDTIGSVSVGGIDLFHALFRPLLFDAHMARARRRRPTWRGSSPSTASEIAAVIMEPLVQGAAGMLVHPPGYLRAVRELCDRHGVLLICDEVATGFGRTGHDVRLRAGGRHARPDVRRQGHHRRLPAARRDARDRARSTSRFLGELAEFKTFFHGHTYTGNPLACAAALATLDVLRVRSTRSSALVAKIDLLGTLLAEHVAPLPARRPRSAAAASWPASSSRASRSRSASATRSRSRRVERGAIIRPLGDVVVLMPPLSISDDELRRLVAITGESIAAAASSSGMTPDRRAGGRPQVAARR